MKTNMDLLSNLKDLFELLKPNLSHAAINTATDRTSHTWGWQTHNMMCQRFIELKTISRPLVNLRNSSLVVIRSHLYSLIYNFWVKYSLFYGIWVVLCFVLGFFLGGGLLILFCQTRTFQILLRTCRYCYGETGKALPKQLHIVGSTLLSKILLLSYIV